MKHAYLIRIRAALWVIFGITCLAATPAMADEPAWWTQQKRDCGLPSSLAYNNWDGQCNSSPSGSAAVPSHDYEAARRAQEAATERQRQEEADRIRREQQAAEEKRQKDAAFIRDRDAAASTLKGSTGSAMNQLKGFAGTDNSGLKGSGFDTGNTGLKGLRGSDPSNQKAGPQPETPHSSLVGSASNEDSKNKEACRPSQDPSVVDLCFLGGRHAAIDPRILKGMNPAEKAAIKTSAISMTENLLPFDKETYQGLADMMGAAHAKTGKQWPGPDNTGTRYLNPLTEPEKVKAYWSKVNSELHAHAEAAARIVTATRKGADWRDLLARQEADPEFRQSKEQIMQSQDKAEGLARHQMLIKFRAFLEKQGGADWPDRIKNDKLFAARMVMEREALFKKMDQEIYSARAKALQQMTVLVKGWKAK